MTNEKVDEWHFVLPVNPAAKMTAYVENGNEAMCWDDHMEEGVMWHIKFGPAKSDDPLLGGTIALLRVLEEQVVPSSWEAAKNAIVQNFKGVSDVKQQQVEFHSEYSDTKRKTVPFSLQGESRGSHEGISREEGGWYLSTSNKDKYYRISGKAIRGLITSENEIALCEAAKFLMKQFGFTTVYWISRYNDPEMWRKTW